jgi:membrane protein
VKLFSRRRTQRGPQVRSWSSGESGNGGAPGVEAPAEAGPAPQPEHHEPPLHDPGLFDLSRKDWVAIVKRAAKEAMADEVTDRAAALAYYAFLAIPATLLVVVGAFGLVASPDAIQTLLEKVGTVVPRETVTLLDDSLTRLSENESSGGIMVVVGLVLALWTSSGAMNALMRGLNVVYDVKETRGFVQQRLTALGMLAASIAAVALVFGLLVLGPVLSKWIGEALGLEEMFGWIWWTVQWPILVGALLVVFGLILYLGPNVEERKLSFLTPGAAVAVVIWLAASGLFSLYVSMFGSYNKAWGSLSAVIVMLTWLWLSSLAILFGGEINAEARRSRALRERAA